MTGILNSKEGRLVKRFLLAFIETHYGVIGDVAAVYMTFTNEPFVQDLCIYQVSRKLSAIGLRDALITFLLQDQGFLHMIGFSGG